MASSVYLVRLVTSRDAVAFPHMITTECAQLDDDGLDVEIQYQTIFETQGPMATLGSCGPLYTALLVARRRDA